MLKREGDQWFWIGYGQEAVAMANDCAHRARTAGLFDVAAVWDRWADRCGADTTKPLKIKLPAAYVECRINCARYF